eukprot:1158612-Pelagomonas_calceolata.AAC.6
MSAALFIPVNCPALDKHQLLRQVAEMGNYEQIHMSHALFPSIGNHAYRFKVGDTCQKVADEGYAPSTYRSAIYTSKKHRSLSMKAHG